VVAVLLGALLLTAVLAASERRPDATIHPVVPQPWPPVQFPEPHTIMIEEYAPANTAIDLDLPTHIGFFRGLEIITEVIHDRLDYRAAGSAGEWQISPIPLESPHSLTWCGFTGQFLASDTFNHRLVWFEDISSGDVTSTDTVGGIELHRPHDVACDAVNEFQYALNPIRPILFRMRARGIDESSLDLGSIAGYSRALTLVDGTLYVVASSMGRVIEINDYAGGSYTVYQSHGKIAEEQVGSWETTGFVLNDVEFFDGWWYATNFFAEPWANGSDHNRFKFVRFRSWNDFELGNWQELSHLLPDGGVPYFLTLHDGSLYLPVFDGLVVNDAVYRITTGLFIDGFESGELSAWSSAEP
jgi:hypothetical protein